MALSKIIAVVGTNASGKSAVGLELARIFGGEIISADSRQVFRGFDLCSGKVTKEERRLIPHHLIDIRDIGEPFSVADFQGLAYDAAEGIAARGKLPFIVGGTGLYVNAVVRGYALQEGTPDRSFREEMEPLSVEELQSRLSPEGRAFLMERPSDYQNKRRIIRVLEKCARGEPLDYENIPGHDALMIGVTWPKDLLRERIEERLSARIGQGMVEEVKGYLDGGGDPKLLFDLGLEYRHTLWYLTGEYSTLEEFRAALARAIGQFAKRQMTWFRRDKSIRWIDMASDPIGEAGALVAEFLGR
jgi:tRNA dimethylallyltransferase